MRLYLDFNRTDTQGTGSHPSKISFIVSRVMKQPSAPDIFAADQALALAVRTPRHLVAAAAVDLDSIPTLSILTTLWDQPRWLEAYHLYDDQGSELFEEICELPEYYLTRTENSILEAQAKNIIAAAPVRVHRRARRRLQQENRPPAHRAVAPARPLPIRAHRCQHRRSARLPSGGAPRFPANPVPRHPLALRRRILRHR